MENRKLLLRITLVCGIILLLFFLFIQSGFSEIFRQFIYEFLVYNQSFEVNGEIYYETTVSLSALKLLLIVLVVAAIFAAAFASYLIARGRINASIQELSTKIPKFLTTEELTTTGDLSLDNELLKIKTGNMKNEELLKRETQRTKDLITYLAHDLKTPLASVIGYLNLLIDSPELTTEQRAKFLQITLDKAGRLEELINEFFDITRFSLQDIHLDKTAMDMVLLTQQMTEEFYPLLSEKNQQLTYEGPDTLNIEADSEQLARVLNNLFKNALSYGNADSVIQVKLSESDKTIHLSVSNEGITIPQRQLEMIFDKFYRLDHARSTKTGGAGLGLAIAKEIMIAHGGTIHAVSEDGLTTFELELPKS
ncbi:sensor histidine kinase [Enterococcus sp. BWR-S5]|uniref:sensor histidine kinase n=1 Tax=Enterococcus sp. BWR-S5 TaxID=2787714 RepID=UPI001922E19B|nr:HAMP domain-containing sensor histidine kinase [Enterococcus sp. BWR-S5]MBL1225531.1 HAMP domain-containing histidine kinase [Enterococcus sp. BWR-S5]